MSTSLPPGVGVPLRYPAPRGGPGRARAPWGALEFAVLFSYLMPALLYVPAFMSGPGRILTRAGAYAVPLAAWLAVLLRVPGPPVGRPYPPAPWLAFCAGWLVLMIAHPLTNTPLAGLAHVAMQVAVMAPAFWVPRLTVPPARLRRVILLIFGFAVFSSVLGIAQYFRPQTFYPNVQAFIGSVEESALSIQRADGQRVYRPQGLGLGPGQACNGGMFAGMIGLGLAFRPGRWRLRAMALAAVGCGGMIIIMCQARYALFCLLFAAALTFALYLAQGQAKRATQLAVLGTLLLAGGIAWAMRVGGEGVASRYLRTFEELKADPLAHYNSNRGHYLADVVEYILPAFPLGAGVGRYGTAAMYFSDNRLTPDIAAPGAYFVELQVNGWAVDGGVPLLVGYLGAVALALGRGVRIARTCPSSEVAADAALVTAMGGAIALSVLNCQTFLIADLGIPFWTLLAALHAADRHARAEHRRRRQLARRAPPAARRAGGP